MAQLRSVTCHMGSHSVTSTCYPTQVNTPRLNPSHAGRYSIYLPRRDGRLSWLSWLDSAPAGSRTCDLSITSPTLNQCNHQDNHQVSPLEYDFTTFNHLHRPYSLKLRTSWVLNRKRWCHLSNVLKHAANKQTAKISMSEIAIVSMPPGYSDHAVQSAFSATAALLVIFHMPNNQIRRDSDINAIILFYISHYQ